MQDTAQVYPCEAGSCSWPRAHTHTPATDLETSRMRFLCHCTLSDKACTGLSFVSIHKTPGAAWL